MKVYMTKGKGFFKPWVIVSGWILALVITCMILLSLGCQRNRSEIRQYLNATGEMTYPAECPRCKRLCPEINQPCCWCGYEKMRRPDGR